MNLDSLAGLSYVRGQHDVLETMLELLDKYEETAGSELPGVADALLFVRAFIQTCAKGLPPKPSGEAAEAAILARRFC